MRLASLAMAAVMLFTLSGITVFAHGSDPGSNVSEAPKPASSASKETKPNEKLRTDVLKLVADAKAGKVAPRAAEQFPRSGRNNLSTGAKIGIGAAIAGAIVVIVILAKLNSD
jgi:hypothetical protein